MRVASAALWFCGWRAQARASCSTSTAAFSGNSGFGVEGTSCSRFHSPGEKEGDVQTGRIKLLGRFLALSLPDHPANEFGVDSWPAHPARRDDPCLACVAGSTMGPWVRCCFRWALFLNFGFLNFAPLVRFWLLQSVPGPPVVGCWKPSAFWPPPPANASVGLRQLFVKRSCVDACFAWART